MTRSNSSAYLPVKDQGTVLRLISLGEDGLIITWCTANHGLIRTAARHARKPGSEFAGNIDLFHECELMYKPSGRSDLLNLQSIVLLDARLSLRKNLARLRLASYLAQLLLATLEPGSEEPEWHNLIAKALDYIAISTPRQAILHRFERRLAEMHGLYSPTISPHQALLKHAQHLPAGRDLLLQSLP